MTQQKQYFSPWLQDKRQVVAASDNRGLEELKDYSFVALVYQNVCVKKNLDESIITWNAHSIL